MSTKSVFAAALVVGVAFLLDLDVFGMVCSFKNGFYDYVAIIAALQHKLF
jgi:hypothetical protein